MALVKDGLWSIVSGTETAPAATEAEKFAKFVSRRDKALAIIVLSVDPSLLYLLGDPEDPVAVWKKLLVSVSEENMGKQIVFETTVE